MEIELALREPPSSLSRHLALTKVRAGGRRARAGSPHRQRAEIFEAFYRQHVEAIQGFVARRIGERERAADLTAEIFLAAIGAGRWPMRASARR